MEYVIRYREQLSGGVFRFLMEEGGDNVYTAARADEAYAEAHRRLDQGPVMDWRIDTVSAYTPAGTGKKK